MFKQAHISQERYETLSARYKEFVEVANDPNKEPVRVYDPLTPQQLQELALIREVSQQLQAKKEEDMKKAAQAKEEAKKAAEQKKEVKEEAAVQEPEETKKEE